MGWGGVQKNIFQKFPINSAIGFLNKYDYER